MFQRDDEGDLTAQERLLFVNAVDNTKLQGRTMTEVSGEWRMNQRFYAWSKKHLMEDVSFESKMSLTALSSKLSRS